MIFRKLQIWLGALVLLLSIVAQAPATVLALLVQSGLPAITVDHVAGTFWRGHASGLVARINGQTLALSDLHWRVAPLSLLILRPTASFDARQTGQAFSGSVAWGVFNRWQLRDVSARLPLQQLGLHTPLALTGWVDASIDTLSIRGGEVAALRGTVDWQDVVATGEGQSLPLGNFRAALTPGGDGGIAAVIADTGGVLRLKADVTLTPAGDYTFSGLVAPGLGADVRLRTVLPLFGEDRGAQGYHLALHGDAW